MLRARCHFHTRCNAVAQQSPRQGARRWTSHQRRVCIDRHFRTSLRIKTRQVASVRELFTKRVRCRILVLRVVRVGPVLWMMSAIRIFRQLTRQWAAVKSLRFSFSFSFRLSGEGAADLLHVSSVIQIVGHYNPVAIQVEKIPRFGHKTQSLHLLPSR